MCFTSWFTTNTTCANTFPCPLFISWCWKFNIINTAICRYIMEHTLNVSYMQSGFFICSCGVRHSVITNKCSFFTPFPCKRWLIVEANIFKLVVYIVEQKTNILWYFVCYGEIFFCFIKINFREWKYNSSNVSTSGFFSNFTLNVLMIA